MATCVGLESPGPLPPLAGDFRIDMTPSTLSLLLGRAWRSLLTLAVLFVGLSAAPALAADEVRLLKAFSAVSNRYGYTWQDTQYTVLVKNLAYDKQVVIHGRDLSGAWVDLSATYAGPADNGYEVWKASRTYANYPSGPAETTRDLEFVVRYTVNGQTYWDNNNGQNYVLGKNDGSLVIGANVLVASSYLDNSGHFSLGVDVRNLAYGKDVAVVYSKDGGQTWQEAALTYNYSYVYGYAHLSSPNVHNIERWTAFISGNLTQTIRFAVRYTVNGQTYWDNNFGHDYTVHAAQ